MTVTMTMYGDFDLVDLSGPLTALEALDCGGLAAAVEITTEVVMHAVRRNPAHGDLGAVSDACLLVALAAQMPGVTAVRLAAMTADLRAELDVLAAAGETLAGLTQAQRARVAAAVRAARLDDRVGPMVVWLVGELSSSPTV